MIETVASYNSFWLIISTVVIVVIITIGMVIRGKSGDKKDTFIFAKSSDNAKDITLDINKTHSEIIAGLPIEYHQEIHSLEVAVDKNTDLIKEINQKLDNLIERVLILEKKQ